MNNRVLVIAGSGRSGTTWIQDAIAQANGMRTLFEPLHPVGVPGSKGLGYRYVAAGDEDPALEEFLGEVFSGRMRSLWANYRIRADRFNPFTNKPQNVLHNALKLISHYPVYRLRPSNSNGVVVKFIRANLMLRWMAERYDYPILLVIRHPAAVVASRMKIGNADWAADKALLRYSSDRVIAGLIQTEFGVDLARPRTPEAALACVWCVENLLPLRWAAKSGITVVGYEALLGDPAREWARLGRELGFDRLPGQELLETPSQQTTGESREKKFGRTQLGKWRQSLTSGQLEEIGNVLEAFGTNIYTMDDDLPRTDAGSLADSTGAGR